MSCDCSCSVSLSHGAMGWSVHGCGFGISGPYSLTFFITDITNSRKARMANFKKLIFLSMYVEH